MSQHGFRLVPNPEGMEPSTMTPAEAFTTADHSEINLTSYATEDESILAGVWECAPCREEIDAYPVHEMMTVISGSVTLTHPDGRSETFRAGDTFFIAKGSPCVWEITETLRKFYMIAE
ncbi:MULTISPECIES: cupin domain-containing protein [unclassified Roseovarius]|uniref:cupin domain-containing protein n=1 Tax=unclassified Roseovarius TaxID=2614913 RepID=UPI00273D582C|nr:MULTISPECIES: cupin domain-containing protein [unclassified Roseovarius]